MGISRLILGDERVSVSLHSHEISRCGDLRDHYGREELRFLFHSLLGVDFHLSKNDPDGNNTEANQIRC